jgi:hypothetical protein
MVLEKKRELEDGEYCPRYMHVQEWGVPSHYRSGDKSLTFTYFAFYFFYFLFGRCSRTREPRSTTRVIKHPKFLEYEHNVKIMNL